jgi:hypothetical protein
VSKDKSRLKVDVELSLDAESGDRVEEAVTETFRGAARGATAAFEQAGERIGESLTGAFDKAAARLQEVATAAEKTAETTAEKVKEASKAADKPKEEEGDKKLSFGKNVFAPLAKDLGAAFTQARTGAAALGTEVGRVLLREMRAGMSEGERALVAGLGQMKTHIGMIPAWISTSVRNSGLGKAVGGALSSVRDAAKPYTEAIGGYFTSLATTIRGKLSTLTTPWGQIAGAAGNAARAVGTAFTNTVGVLQQKLGAGLKGVLNFDVGGYVGKGVDFLKTFGRESVQAAMKADDAWRRLGSTVAGQRIPFGKVSQDLHEAAAEFARKTTFSTTEYATGLTAMIGATGNYKRSVELMGTAADVAAKRNIDLKTASELVGRAAHGSTDALGELGIHTTDAAKGFEQLRKETKGYAESEATTFQGKLKQLGNTWEELQIAVGNAMIEAGSGTTVMDTLKGVIVSLTEWVTKNAGEIGFWGSVIITVVKASVVTLWELVKVLFNIGQSIGNLIGVVVTGANAMILEGLNKLFSGLNWIGDEIHRITGMDTWHLPTLEVNVGEAKAQVAGFAGALRDNVNDITGSFRSIGQAWGEVGTSLSRWPTTRPPVPLPASPAHPEVIEHPQGGTRSTPSHGPSTTASSSRREVVTTVNVDQSHIAGGISIRPMSMPVSPLQTALAKVPDQVKQWKEAHNKLLDIAQTVAQGYTQAWQNAFALIIAGGANAGEVIATLAKGMAAALLNGLAQYANGKVSENVAQAFESFATGLQLAANPATAYLAPIAYSAGKGYLLSAAKWGLVAGAAGAAAGAASGGGGGGGGGGSKPKSSRDAAGGVAQNAQKSGPQIHVYVDGMDPRNPRHQQLTQQTLQGVQERYGQTGAVTYHPAGAR